MTAEHWIPVVPAPPPDVSRMIMWETVPEGAPVASMLTWARCDPHAMQIRFNSGQGDNERVWTVARELLATALITGHCGEGDMTFIRGGEEVRKSGRTLLCESNHGDKMWCFLASHEGQAIVAADADALSEFITTTHAMVPLHGETDVYLESIDTELDILLKSELDGD